MFTHRMHFVLALALIPGAAPIAGAQQHRPLFTWSGRVDREVTIAMRGRDVWARGASSHDGWRSRTQVRSPLPQDAGLVRASLEDGRGDVSVIQQPSARNDYTAIIRLRDRSGGADRYRVSAYWERDAYRRNGDDRDRGSRNGRDARDADRDDRDVAARPPRTDGVGRRARDRDDDDERGDDDRGYGRGARMDGGSTALPSAGEMRTAVRWSGTVDRGVELRMQGRRIDVMTLGGEATRSVRSTVVSGLPQRAVQVSVARRQGRGNVLVVQQPTASNGYTTVLRVLDPQGGADFYDFDLLWR